MTKTPDLESRAASTDDLCATRFAAEWLSIGAVATSDRNREIDADGHRATMEMMTRTGGAL